MEKVNTLDYINQMFPTEEEKQQKVNDFNKVFTLEDDTNVSASGAEVPSSLSNPNFNFQLPSKIATMLYPHQREGLNWLWSLHCKGKGGILGDDMGLGKTMQICSFLAGLFHSNLTKRVLVVAPKTLLPHWKQELAVVDLAGKTKEYNGTCCAKARHYELQHILQNNGVLLTTYDFVIKIANALSNEHKNDVELWTLFNFACPGLLGDKKCFKDQYEAVILRGHDKNASNRDQCIGSAVAQELRECIQPYFLRRLKDEVFRGDDGSNTAKLSKKNEIIAWLKLSSFQRQVYEGILKSEIVQSAFGGSCLIPEADDVSEGTYLDLNQIDHSVIEKIAETTDIYKDEKHDVLSCKISFIASLLDKLIPEGHNVLIFAQTRRMHNLSRFVPNLEMINTRGYKFLQIDGTTTMLGDQRVSIIFKLVVSDLPLPRLIVLYWLIQLGTQDDQSVDRAYRIGQEKDVLVYCIMTCGTVDVITTVRALKVSATKLRLILLEE
ncbi:SNF2-related, N-terminal domain-containing protein [Tanacetum coccineum]